MNVKELVSSYRPDCEQEACDKEAMLALLESGQELLTRQNPVAHFTASAWIVNPARDLVLMAHHNQYNSWAWLGGHADGNPNLAEVALKEVREESGLQRLHLVTKAPFSLEVLTVFGHEKRGHYVSSHLHLNLTYLVEADPNDPLEAKLDENSNVAWFSPADALAASTEPWFVQRVYTKLIQKVENLRSAC